MGRVLLVLALSQFPPTGMESISKKSGTTKPGSLLTEDASTVLHTYWTGSAIADTKGNTWTQNGTVPQVAASGKNPPGAGPFVNAITAYQLGTGTDVLDFAGDYTVIAVYKHTSTNAGATLLTDGTFQVAGWELYFINSFTQLRIEHESAGANVNVASTASNVEGAVNVVCFGRSGATAMIKLNDGATQSGPAGTITRATSVPARLQGYDANYGNNATDTIFYEVLATTTAVSDALCTSEIAHARSALGLP